MTTTPDPTGASAALTCVYDAWNRLVEVSSFSGELASYPYDGTGRRIVEYTDFTGSVAGDGDVLLLLRSERHRDPHRSPLHLRGRPVRVVLRRWPFSTSTSFRHLA